jgi:hypothetical protein
VDLVEQLLGARGGVHQPAGSGHFGHDDAAARGDLGQREPEAFEVWDVLHSGGGKVAAGHLPCAVEQVAGKRCEPDAANRRRPTRTP